MARTVMTTGWEAEVGEVTSRYVGKVGDAVADDANRLAPHGETGRLGGSYHAVAAGPMEQHVGSGLDYATAIELGAPPHLITIKTKKVLADKVDGEVFGKVVHHPGNQPYPHLRPALYRRREGL